MFVLVFPVLIDLVLSCFVVRALYVDGFIIYAFIVRGLVDYACYFRSFIVQMFRYWQILNSGFPALDCLSEELDFPRFPDQARIDQEAIYEILIASPVMARTPTQQSIELTNGDEYSVKLSKDVALTNIVQYELTYQTYTPDVVWFDLGRSITSTARVAWGITQVWIFRRFIWMCR